MQIATGAKHDHVFGYIYAAVFSNGTVKSGLSDREPKNRLKQHENAGKAFGIEMEASFVASIYTNDLLQREKAMHKEMAQVATLTSGREWFKFDNKEQALVFCSNYLHRLERESFTERPIASTYPGQDDATLGPAQISMEWKDIGADKVCCANLRDVWRELVVKKDFSDWAKCQTQGINLVDGVDFVQCNVKNIHGTGRHKTEYWIPLPHAARIAARSKATNGRAMGERVTKAISESI